MRSKLIPNYSEQQSMKPVIIMLGICMLVPSWQCPERFWGVIGQNPCVSKSNRLHVAIYRFFFTNLR